jgi:hypothetical protein
MEKFQFSAVDSKGKQYTGLVNTENSFAYALVGDTKLPSAFIFDLEPRSIRIVLSVGFDAMACGRTAKAIRAQGIADNFEILKCTKYKHKH